MPTTPTTTTRSITTHDAQRRRGWRELQALPRRAALPGGFEPRRPVAVLAVDPGTRRTGVAVFEGTELVHGRVRDFDYQREIGPVLRGTRRLIEDQIRYFHPQILVLERTFPGYRNKDISKLIAVSDEIRAVAREHSLPIVEYAPRTARLIVCGDGNATKREVAERVCLSYPELRVHLEQTHLWKDTYWSNLFDAACVGLAYLIEKRIAPGPRAVQPAPASRPGS